MANFDMIPPDANELFGFNDLPNENVGRVNWGWVSIVVIVITVSIIISKKIDNRKGRQAGPQK